VNARSLAPRSAWRPRGRHFLFDQSLLVALIVSAVVGAGIWIGWRHRGWLRRIGSAITGSTSTEASGRASDRTVSETCRSCSGERNARYRNRIVDLG
jgi:hypothetical protein